MSFSIIICLTPVAVNFPHDLSHKHMFRHVVEAVSKSFADPVASPSENRSDRIFSTKSNAVPLHPNEYVTIALASGYSWLTMSWEDSQMIGSIPIQQQTIGYIDYIHHYTF